MNNNTGEGRPKSRPQRRERHNESAGLTHFSRTLRGKRNYKKLK